MEKIETNIENVAKKYLRNCILDSIRKDICIKSIINDLNKRCDNMYRSLKNKEEDLNTFSNLVIGLENPNSVRVDKRIKYMFFFIMNVKIEIKNLNWILKNKYKFYTLDNKKMYNLSLFRDKISIKNSEYLPF
jgi:hypothetical protein